MNPQVRFTLTLNATWSVLRDPVLTKIYPRLTPYTLHSTPKNRPKMRFFLHISKKKCIFAPQLQQL